MNKIEVFTIINKNGFSMESTELFTIKNPKLLAALKDVLRKGWFVWAVLLFIKSSFMSSSE